MAGFRGVRLRARLGIGLLQVQLREVDRLEHQRREAAVAHRIGQHPAGEGEEQARRFAQHEGLDLVGGHVAETEEPRIAEVDDEGGLAFGLGANLDLQGQFVDFLADLRGRDVELHVDARCGLRLIDGRGVRVLERQVLHILRDHAGGGAGIVTSRRFEALRQTLFVHRQYLLV